MRHVIAKFHMNTKNITIVFLRRVIVKKIYHKNDRPTFMKSESAPETLVGSNLKKNQVHLVYKKVNHTKSPKEFLYFKNTFFY